MTLKNTYRGGLRKIAILTAAMILLPLTLMPATAADNTEGYNIYQVSGGEYLSLIAVMPGERFKKIGSNDVAITADGRFCQLSTAQTTCDEKTFPGQNGSIIDYSGAFALTSSMQLKSDIGLDMTAPQGTVEISMGEGWSAGRSVLLMRTSDGDVYLSRDMSSIQKIYDHTAGNGPATSILSTSDEPRVVLYLAGGHLFQVKDDNTSDDITPKGVTLAGKFSASTTNSGTESIYLADDQGRVWQFKPSKLGESTAALGLYAKTGIASATGSVYIDNDNVLRSSKSGNPVNGRRFVSLMRSSTDTYALEDPTFNHSETTTVGAIPQSGDPAASWRQQLTVLMSLLVIAGAIMAWRLSRQRPV